MNRIQQYFNGISKRIAADYETAGVSTHRPDIGANRERIVVEFLEKHLPKRLTATLGGQVIGSDGSESKQIDILISSDISLRFDQHEKTFVTVESLAGAISVKSRLDKQTLEDCLLNLASIPQVDSDVLVMQRMSPDAYDSFMLMYPCLYVFAYEGMSADTCYAQVKNFYSNHPEIPKNRYVGGVIVNGKYIVQYRHDEITFEDGIKGAPGELWGTPLDGRNIGYPFSCLLNDLVYYVPWLTEIDIAIERYFHTSFRTM